MIKPLIFPAVNCWAIIKCPYGTESQEMADMASIESRNVVARNGQPFVIRTARTDDAAALLTYVQTLAREAPYLLIEADEFDLPEEQERKWIQDHIDRPGWIALMAESDGEPVGVLSFENGPYRRVAHRGGFGVSVAKPWRGQGVGTALIETLLQWAADYPLLEKVGMEVFVTNEDAIRLYKRLGFVEEGVKAKEIKLGDGRYVDLVVMCRFVK